MLNIENLSFSFGNKTIFSDISLRFNENQVTGLVGKNGVGKTTLFRIITGIYKMQKGIITLNGRKLSPSEISFMPTEPFFYPYMKGKEYLEIVASLPRELSEAVRYSQILDLPLDELVDNYSTGMRKKLAFSALFSLDKPVIILDEPYNGVDLEGNEIIQHIIKSNGNEKAVLFSSHILSTITNISDSVYHICDWSDITQYLSADFVSLEQKLQKNMHQKLFESGL
ncbi:MAG: ATP-binding cassette domain-containing protein [Saprospiraceae bacterium]|nr:ATP-binding cassette domain-containing protein [Saprospiraceae bacterium]